MNFKFLVLTLATVALTCCTYEQQSVNYDAAPANARFSVLRAAAVSRTTITDSLIFRGRVTADDRTDNFYRKIVVEDLSGAVELCIKLHSLHVLYPEGTEVVLRARGLATTVYDGAVQLGAALYGWSGGTVEPLASLVDADRHIALGARPATICPATVVPEELTDEMCGRLVRVEKLIFRGSESDWGSVDWGSSAYRLFVSASDDSLAVVTSKYASFASEKIPADTVAISGILYKHSFMGRQRYVIKMRRTEDVETMR